MKPIAIAVLFICVHCSSFGQNFHCLTLINGEQECTRTELHPAGPTIFKEWRRDHEDYPYLIEVLGARSGCVLMGSFSLKLLVDRSWILVMMNGNTMPLLKAIENVPRSIQVIQSNGYEWTVTVLSQDIPPIGIGYVTEDEPKLNLQIGRSLGLKN